jgi:hypothetical protein
VAAYQQGAGLFCCRPDRPVCASAGPSFTTRPHLAANSRLPVPNPRRCCPSMPARNGLSAAQRSRMEFLGGTIIWAKELLDAAYLKQLRDLPAVAKGREVFLGPFKVQPIQGTCRIGYLPIKWPFH